MMRSRKFSILNLDPNREKHIPDLEEVVSIRTETHKLVNAHMTYDDETVETQYRHFRYAPYSF